MDRTGYRVRSSEGATVRLAAAATALAVVLGVTACSGTGTGGTPSAPPTTAAPSTASPTPSPPPTTAGPTSSSVDSATPDASSSTPVAIAPITGYGATLAVWAAHHTADERFDPGAMWDPTPGWGPDEAHNDKFNTTVVTAERVLRYDMYLPRAGVAAATAITLATATLPKDAVILWRRQLTTCYAVQLTSASLGKVLAGAPFANPQGQVQLQLRSGAAPTTVFDPARVTTVLVRPSLASTPADFPGC